VLREHSLSDRKYGVHQRLGLVLRRHCCGPRSSRRMILVGGFGVGAVTCVFVPVTITCSLPVFPGTSRAVSGSCCPEPCFPWPSAFSPSPPPLPRLAPPLCLGFSSILCLGPTPHRHGRPDCGLRLPEPLPPQVGGDQPARYPGSRACCFSACAGSQTTGDPTAPRIGGAASVAFPAGCPVGISDDLFEALYPAHQYRCLGFDADLAISPARLEARMVRYSFPVGLVHPRQHASLSRRSTC
jgi:hypothetical protein